MEGARATEPRERSSVVAVFEGALLKDIDTFPYFMLLAFEASSVISFVRFVILLLSWPLVWLMCRLGARGACLKVMIFVSTAWVKVEEVEWVARAVLPKFYMDDLDLDAWKVFDAHEGKVVVTSCPRVMVEMFAKEHLGAHEVIGGELEVNRLGYATGFLRKPEESICKRVEEVVGTEGVETGIVGRTMMVGSFLPLCKDHLYPPFNNHPHIHKSQLYHPPPVVFHDGRLVPRPTPMMSLLILLWLPFGILAAFIRILVGLNVPMSLIPYTVRLFGGRLTIHGPLPPSSPTGTLFVCTHRTLMDPVILSMVLARQIPAVTYSISRISELLSPIPTIPLSRNRLVDAEMIRAHLSQGDLVVCPEGTTCREPFLLRFSALFAELTDRIVPVAMNHRVGFFHATTARGWKGLDPIFFTMNPRPEYEVTFLSQLSVEATVASGRKPEDVANYVQRMLATTLGFECTEFTRRDKYKVLAGNDGIVASPGRSTVATAIEHARKVVLGLWKAAKV